jgi:hypothetical protein
MLTSGYTKLFGSILTSSVWQEPAHVRLVWITFLALCNKDGLIEAAVPGIAHVARVSLPEAEEAIKVLESPDEYSRNHEHDGRRIIKVDGGWKVLNFDNYRNKLSEADRREYFRRKQAEYRAKHKAA